jgi:acetyl esterase/lipase
MRKNLIFFMIVLLWGLKFLCAQGLFERQIVYRVPGMEKVKIHQDVTYKSVEAKDLKMDIYTPSGLSAESCLPAVIFIHGGYLPPTITVLPKDWGMFKSYGKLMAASEFIGITFNHRYFGWDEENLKKSFDDVRDAHFLKGS